MIPWFIVHNLTQGVSGTAVELCELSGTHQKAECNISYKRLLQTNNIKLNMHIEELSCLSLICLTIKMLCSFVSDSIRVFEY